ncbi:hypothetical protein SARC_08509 [Sphaeroforma arctica JP610]|uniref:Uncharacterized protein n=1 Tax=Sphaeroforma arctica JP610 TaxID=667725 RepID=A0A0L0FQN4_9EUKA|nr:hypothetical protein SARC_08509 [Sphaeroforma arctica JP610]KNC79087.1 hypothetical protein SARC_08509 [Sphaeroforma arctica JP610]|eukprot:XP_014152989.1 hypothetical protein SARC_08509 [Sphaeroforma arctica JP610]
MSIDRHGQHIALLRDRRLEIRSSADNFKVCRVQVRVTEDRAPRWRVMAWGGGANLLAVISGGKIHIVTTLGKIWYEIDICSSQQAASDSRPKRSMGGNTTAKARLDLSSAVAAVGFMDVTSVMHTPSLTDEETTTGATTTYLYVLFYNATLYCYELSPPESGSAYTLKHMEDLSQSFTLATTLTVDAAQARLVVGGYPVSRSLPSVQCYRVSPESNGTSHVYRVDLIPSSTTGEPATAQTPSSTDKNQTLSGRATQASGPFMVKTDSIVWRAMTAVVPPALLPGAYQRCPYTAHTAFDQKGARLLALDATGALRVVAYPSFRLLSYISAHTLNVWLMYQHTTARGGTRVSDDSETGLNGLNQILDDSTPSGESKGVSADERRVGYDIKIKDDYVTGASWWDTNCVTLTSKHGLVFVVSIRTNADEKAGDTKATSGVSNAHTGSSEKGRELRTRIGRGPTQGETAEAIVESAGIPDSEREIRYIRNLLHGGVLVLQPSAQVTASVVRERGFAFLEWEEKALPVAHPQFGTENQAGVKTSEEANGEIAGNGLQASTEGTDEHQSTHQQTATDTTTGTHAENTDGMSAAKAKHAAKNKLNIEKETASTRGPIVFVVGFLLLWTLTATSMYACVFRVYTMGQLLVIGAIAALCGVLLLCIYSYVAWGMSLPDALRGGAAAALNGIVLRVHRTYHRLGVVSYVTAEELLTARVRDKQFDVALKLAAVYNLNTDVVYQQQWMDTCGVDPLAMSRYLDHISDVDWVLNECTTVVLETADRCRELLEYGLNLTNNSDTWDHTDEDLQSPNVGAPMNHGTELSDENADADANAMGSVGHSVPSEEQLRMWACRRQLLQYSDRLRTYEEILLRTKEHFNPSEYMVFRECNLVDAALQFARDQHFEALHTLLTYHHQATLPHWLSILSTVPENVHPDNYATILPKCNVDDNGTVAVQQWLVQSWREPDWVEKEPYLSLKGEQCVASSAETHNTHSHPTEPSASIVTFDLPTIESNPTATAAAADACVISGLNPSSLTSWYISRVIEIDSLSGQVDIALALARAGVRDGVPGLEGIESIAATLTLLVFKAQSVPHGMHLDEYTTLPGVTRFALLFEGCDTNDTFIKRFEKHGKAFLSALSQLSVSSTKITPTQMPVMRLPTEHTPMSTSFRSWVGSSTPTLTTSTLYRRAMARYSPGVLAHPSTHTEETHGGDDVPHSRTSARRAHSVVVNPGRIASVDEGMSRHKSNPVAPLDTDKQALSATDEGARLLSSYMTQLAHDQYLARCRLLLCEADSLGLCGGKAWGSRRAAPGLQTLKDTWKGMRADMAFTERRDSLETRADVRVGRLDLLAIAVECVHACDDTAQLGEQRRIATWIKETVERIRAEQDTSLPLDTEDANQPTANANGGEAVPIALTTEDLLLSALLTVQFIEASHKLWQYNVKKTVRDISEGGAGHAQDLIKLMCKNALHQRPAPTADQWREQLGLMLELKDGVMAGQITTEFVLSSYLEALLNTNNAVIITMAREVIAPATSSHSKDSDQSNHDTVGTRDGSSGLDTSSVSSWRDQNWAPPTLTQKQAEPIVVKAAREYYNSAVSVRDTALDISRACLRLLPASTNARGTSVARKHGNQYGHTHTQAGSHENMHEERSNQNAQKSVAFSSVAEELRLHEVCVRVKALPKSVSERLVPVQFRILDDGEKLLEHVLGLWFPLPTGARGHTAKERRRRRKPETHTHMHTPRKQRTRTPTQTPTPMHGGGEGQGRQQVRGSKTRARTGAGADWSPSDSGVGEQDNATLGVHNRGNEFTSTSAEDTDDSDANDGRAVYATPRSTPADTVSHTLATTDPHKRTNLSERSAHLSTARPATATPKPTPALMTRVDVLKLISLADAVGMYSPGNASDVQRGFMLGLLAVHALRTGAHTTSKALCEEIMESPVTLALGWDACLQLGECAAYTDTQARRACLGAAAQSCGRLVLDRALRALRVLEWEEARAAVLATGEVSELAATAAIGDRGGVKVKGSSEGTSGSVRGDADRDADRDVDVVDCVLRASVRHVQGMDWSGKDGQMVVAWGSGNVSVGLDSADTDTATPTTGSRRVGAQGRGGALSGDMKNVALSIAFTCLDSRLRKDTRYPLRGSVDSSSRSGGVKEKERSAASGQTGGHAGLQRLSALSAPVAALRLHMLDQFAYDEPPQRRGTNCLPLDIAKHALRSDPLLFVSSLVAVGQPNEIDAFLEKLPRQLQTSELGVYIFRLSCVLARQTPTDKESQLASSWATEPFADTIARSEQESYSQCATLALAHKWEAKLSDIRLGSEIATHMEFLDEDRFRDDSDYQTSVMDELLQKPRADTFDAAVQMAKRYDLDVWEMAAKHLKAVMTQPLESNVRKARVRDAKTYLLANPDRLERALVADIMPLLDGTDLPGFLICYELAVLCAGPNGANGPQTPPSGTALPRNRKAGSPSSLRSGNSTNTTVYDHDIRSLQRLKLIGLFRKGANGPALDYRRLRTGGQATLDAALEVATFKNIKGLAQVVSAITNAAYLDGTLDGARVSAKKTYAYFIAHRLQLAWETYLSAAETKAVVHTAATHTRSTGTNETDRHYDYNALRSVRDASNNTEVTESTAKDSGANAFLELAEHVCASDVFLSLLSGEALLHIVHSLLLVSAQTQGDGIRTPNKQLPLQHRYTILQRVRAACDHSKANASETKPSNEAQRKRKERQTAEEHRILQRIEYACQHVLSLTEDPVYETLATVGRPCYTAQLDAAFTHSHTLLRVLAHMAINQSVQWSTLVQCREALVRVEERNDAKDQAGSQEKVVDMEQVLTLGVDRALVECMSMLTNGDEVEQIRQRLEPVLLCIDEYIADEETAPVNQNHEEVENVTGANQTSAFRASVKNTLTNVVSNHEYALPNRLALLQILTDKRYYEDDDTCQLVALYCKIDSLCRAVGLSLEDISSGAPESTDTTASESIGSTNTQMLADIPSREHMLSSLLNTDGVSQSPEQLAALIGIVALLCEHENATDGTMHATNTNDARKAVQSETDGAVPRHIYRPFWRDLIGLHAALVEDQTVVLNCRSAMSTIVPGQSVMECDDDMRVLSTLLKKGQTCVAVQYAFIAASQHAHTPADTGTDMSKRNTNKVKSRKGVDSIGDSIACLGNDAVMLVERVVPVMLLLSAEEASVCARRDEVISMLMLSADNPYVIYNGTIHTPTDAKEPSDTAAQPSGVQDAELDTNTFIHQRKLTEGNRSESSPPPPPPITVLANTVYYHKTVEAMHLRGCVWVGQDTTRPNAILVRTVCALVCAGLPREAMSLVATTFYGMPLAMVNVHVGGRMLERFLEAARRDAEAEWDRQVQNTLHNAQTNEDMGREAEDEDNYVSGVPAFACTMVGLLKMVRECEHYTSLRRAWW